LRSFFIILTAALFFASAGCGPGAGGGTVTPGGKSVPVAGAVEPGDDTGSGNIPDISLERVDGQGNIRLRSLARDKVVIVVFWSTYCDSCKSELVGLKSFYKDYSGKGVEVLAVSMDKPDTASDVQSDVHKYSLPYPVVFDTESRASGSLNPTNAQPFTVVIDKNMNVIFTHESYFSGDLEKIKKAALDALDK